jgi:hypothetical protein
MAPTKRANNNRSCSHCRQSRGEKTREFSEQNIPLSEVPRKAERTSNLLHLEGTRWRDELCTHAANR